MKRLLLAVSAVLLLSACGEDPSTEPPPPPAKPAPHSVRTGLAEPYGLAVSGNVVGWSSEAGTVEYIFRGDASRRGSVTGLTEPRAVAVDGTHLAFTDFGTGRVVIGPLAGGVATTISGSEYQPSEVLLEADFVYWATEAINGGVYKAPRAGGARTVLSSNQSSISGLVLAGNYLYWASYFDGTLSRVHKDGGPTEILLRSLSYPVDVATDGTDVYVAFSGGLGAQDEGGVLRWAPASRQTTHVARGQPYLNSIAAGGGRVFFTAPRGEVRAVAAGGGEVEVLATEQNRPTSITHDGTEVYWVNQGDPGGTNGRIMSLRATP